MSRHAAGVALAAALLFGGPAAGEDELAYPRGWSLQKRETVTFDLLVPQDLSRDRPGSLLLVVYGGTATDIAQRLQPYAGAGFVVCIPKPDWGRGGGTSLGADVLDLVDHLAAALPIGEGRRHCLCLEDKDGFSFPVAFGRGSRFAGVCLVSPKPYAIPLVTARPRGVLVIGATQTFVARLEDRLPGAEIRPFEKDPLPGPYLRWWFRLMEGAFIPGDDLTLAWSDLPDPPEAAALRKRLADAGTGALVYFHAQADAADPDAKRLQTETLRDPLVRAAAGPLVAWKIDRGVHPALSQELGCEATPTLLILDREFRRAGFVDARVQAKDLAVALRKVAPAPGASGGRAFPPGISRHTWKGRSFEMFVPQGLPPSGPHSLVLAVGSSAGDLPRQLGNLVGAGFVLCAPAPRTLDSWMTNEVEELLELVEHLREVLPSAEGRLHVISQKYLLGFGTQLAFHKKARFSGACFIEAWPSGASPPSDARKRLGVLSFGGVDLHTSDAKSRNVVDRVRDLVRVAEFRRDGAEAFGPYLVWWLRAMEGRFTPGDDLSFDWRTPKDASEAVTVAQAAGNAALLWFHHPQDATDADARALQTHVFLQDRVRQAGNPLVAMRFDRAAHGELFESLGLQRTPALVITDATLKPLARFEGAVDAERLALALEKASPPAKKPR